MKREDLFRNSGYWFAKIQVELYNQINDYMAENNLNQTQLAKKLGFSKGHISQVLGGDCNFGLSKLVDLCLSIGKVPHLSFMGVEQLINFETKQQYEDPDSWQITNNIDFNQPNLTTVSGEEESFTIGGDLPLQKFM
jgi:predicted XRE-type DNA-binding protein